MNILAFIFSLLLLFSLFFSQSNEKMQDIYVIENHFLQDLKKGRKRENERVSSKFARLNPKEKKKSSSTGVKGGKSIRLNLYSFCHGQDERLLEFLSQLLAGLYPHGWEDISPREFAKELASSIYATFQKDPSLLHLGKIEMRNSAMQRYYYSLLRSPDRSFKDFFYLSPKKSKIALQKAPLFYLEILFGTKIAQAIYHKDPFPTMEEIELLCQREGVSLLYSEFMTTKRSTSFPALRKSLLE